MRPVYDAANAPAATRRVAPLPSSCC